MGEEMAFIPYNQYQRQLIPTNLSDLVPDDHLVVAVNDVVERLEISPILTKYRDGGRDAFHPRILLKILFYGYACGERSSRVLEDKLKHDVFYMWLAAMQTPNFSTIAHFRQENLKEIKELFIQVLLVCKEMGLVRIGHWAIDGTKVKANASRWKSRTREFLEEEEKKLREEIDKALKEAQSKDKEEDKLYGKKESGRGLPKELKRTEERLNRIEKAIKKLKDSRTTRTANTTDPEASFMKRPEGGFETAYNAQATVDDLRQVIVATGVTNRPADNTQLMGQIDNGIKNIGGSPREVSADSGYQGCSNLKALEERHIEAYIPQGENPEKGEKKTEATEYTVDNFRYDKNKDIYICPEGRELVFRGLHRGIKKASGSHTTRIYRSTSCQGCKVSTLCAKNPDKGRTIERSELFPLIEKVKKRLATDVGKKIYAKRKYIIEPVFGVIKHIMKFRQFLLRGLEKTKGEWELVCLAYNIRKIWTARANK